MLLILVQIFYIEMVRGKQRFILAFIERFLDVEFELIVLRTLSEVLHIVQIIDTIKSGLKLRK